MGGILWLMLPFFGILRSVALWLRTLNFLNDCKSCVRECAELWLDLCVLNHFENRRFLRHWVWSIMRLFYCCSGWYLRYCPNLCLLLLIFSLLDCAVNEILRLLGDCWNLANIKDWNWMVGKEECKVLIFCLKLVSLSFSFERKSIWIWELRGWV